MASQDTVGEVAKEITCDDNSEDWNKKCNFTLQKLISNKPQGRLCSAKKVPKNGLATLAVPRTGSETLVASILLGKDLHGKERSHQPGLVHDHLCTLPDLIAVNAKRVAMSLRPPDERIVSAYAHRSKGFGKFQAPEGASNAAHDTAINLFLDALKQGDHPKHVEAMTAVKREPFFLYPAAEFYLDDTHLQGKPPGVDFHVLCTCDLDNDIVALGKKWDFNGSVPTEKVSPHGEDGNYKPRLTAENLDWIRSVYKKDYDLHRHWCKKCS
jgi:hypothetical protein